MCGRYALKTPALSVREVLHFDNTPGYQGRYNISPSQDVLVVRQVAGNREGCMMRWGLIPSWAKDLSIGSRMINARAETLAQKPAFRASFRGKRCLIPADGFYEWQIQSSGIKQPFFIHRTDGKVMVMAGIWDHWISGDEDILSCAIITVQAGPAISHIHNRMPAILEADKFDAWLDESASEAELASLLCQPVENVLHSYQVDRRVNKPETDDPQCIEPMVAGPGSTTELF